MSVEQKTCAPTDNKITSWSNINWAKCETEVRKLQERIVKAQKAGKHNRVKSLQWLLTHSYAAKALAVKRVSSNKGKKTAGVDQILWETAADKMNAIKELGRRGYKPMPLKRVNIKKNNGKLRPLGIPTLRDRAMQALHLLALDPVAETTADKHSYGFRKERCAADAISQCWLLLGRGKGCPSWIMEGDIKGCFDHISHEWLLNNIPMDKTILNKWLQCGFVYNKELFLTEEGTPQGGIISPTLANMTLDGLEKVLAQKFSRIRVNGKWTNPAVKMVRYADDFIITGKSREFLEEQVKPVVIDFLMERGLTLSEEKTKITHIEDGFDFLGHNIRKYKNVVLTKPSKKSVKRFLENIKNITRANRTSPQEALIRLLNPVIAGWGNYYRHSVASEIFQSTDSLIFQKLWRWSKRRHSNKSLAWIKNKYFQKIGNRDWCFTWKENEQKEKNFLTLKHLSSIKITRNVKILGEANPYDKQWAQYFDKRDTYKMLMTLKGKMSLLNLWKKQNRLCPVCGQPITKERPWSTVEIAVNGKVVRQLVHDGCRRSVQYSERMHRKS